MCGVVRPRSFTALKNERHPTASCGACVAYLRLAPDSLEVKEERDDATGGFYWIGRAQYESVVPRSNGEDRPFEFQMPAICAVCGAPDAARVRTFDPMATADAGIIGAVAAGVASEVAVDTGLAKANRRYDSNRPSSEAELDLALRHGQMGVCDKHVSITDRGVEYGDGNLVFRSYRHYKAFCKLNAITAETKPPQAEAPQARVVS